MTPSPPLLYHGSLDLIMITDFFPALFHHIISFFRETKKGSCLNSIYVLPLPISYFLHEATNGRLMPHVPFFPFFITIILAVKIDCWFFCKPHLPS